MNLTLFPFRLLISGRDSGCTTVCVTALVCLGTALSPSLQPVTQAHAVFLAAFSVSGRYGSSYLTSNLLLAKPYAGRRW
jgi:hypothetical protein